MKRCLSCGHTFKVEVEDEIEEGEGYSVGIGVLPRKTPKEEVTAMENTELAMEPVAMFVSKIEDECDPATRDLMEDLVKGLSMQLWSVDMLQEKKVAEAKFERLFADYSNWLKSSLERRNEMPEEARDLEPLENELKKAKLSPEELEMRSKIRDVSDEEYGLIMPAIKLDIDPYEEGLRAKKAKRTFLHNLKNVSSRRMR